ncbi:hypothetical protein ACMDCR_02290 [Labrys okinawensis]|uniref:hypothetical protein n=1 Tax=Labrys okinawensis TaxID=346911 RepID=UPI0039BC5BF4
MVRERKVTRLQSAIQIKGVKARREQSQPYASEIEDYASDAVKAPEADPRRQPLETTHGDAADRLRPLEPNRRRKLH